MKLYHYDEKHQQINSYLDLGNLTPKEVELLDHVILFLDECKIMKSYSNLVLANSCKQTYSEGESYLEFDYKGIGE